MYIQDCFTFQEENKLTLKFITEEIFKFRNKYKLDSDPSLKNEFKEVLFYLKSVGNFSDARRKISNNF